MWSALGQALGPPLGLASSIQAIKYAPQKPYLPAGPAKPIPPTSKADIDAKIAQLDPAGWAATSCAGRAEVLESAMWNLIKAVPQFAEASVAVKGSYGQGLGEEMAALFPAVLGMREYAIALKENGQRKPVKLRQAPGTDQYIATTFPWGMMGALLPGYTGHVYIQPGKPPSQGALYQRKAKGEKSPGAVSLVLGAGNQVSVVLLDIVHKLIMDDEVVLCKMSPVNEYLGPLIEKALAPLVDKRALAVVYGGKEVGEYVTHHPKIKSIHLTGSGDTCNAIIWGSATAPRVGEPPLKKEVTAELGNVTPFIIVPGPWSDADIEFHAKAVVAGKLNNAGHNCVALEVIITDKNWPLRGKFMAAVRRALSEAYQRYPYYPGSKEKYQSFRDKFPADKIEELGIPVSPPPSSPYTSYPWLLVEDLSPTDAQTQGEHWCGVIQEVALPGCETPEAFLKQAVKYANKQCWGSLACSMWVHPKTQKELGSSFDQALRDLRYGCITVNTSTLFGYCLPSLPWGGAPGNTVQNVESGIGFVHNSFMFDHPEKGVVHAPWRSAVKPMELPDNRAVPHFMARLLRLVGNLDKPLSAFPDLLVLSTQAIRG